MIGQHLILRCAKGYYDQANSAGIKTAAISESMRRLPSARQQELNKIISEHAQFPDAPMKGGSGDNRGVMRLFAYRGILLVLRTFRVHDLCDTGGTVSFTQTYVIADDEKGEDRQQILKYPQSLCELKCFDDYKAVAKRTNGGLNSGNPVIVNEKIKMPDKDVPRVDAKIFEECGFTEETFAKMISAVCHHVSSKGWVAVIAPNITEKSWDDEGGSLAGEKLVTSTLALLPDCVSRFFGAVSYWNDNPTDNSLKDCQLRVLSGKYTDNLIDGDISLFNTKDNIINTQVEAGTFGKYLWKIKNNPKEIERFHRFIEAAFGKNVDQIAKMPALMDALADLYIFTDKANAKADNKKDRHEGVTVDEQGALSSFLLSIGTALPVFPNIYKGVSLLITSVRESKDDCSSKLENVIMQLLKNPDTVKLNSCYANLIGILMYSINRGTAKDKTEEMIAQQLGSKDGDEYRKQFGNLLSALIDDPKAKPSFSMLSLLLDAEDLEILKPQKDDISAVIKKCYDNALADKDFELCARMTAKQLRKDSPPDNVTELCGRIVELTNYVTPQTADELVKAISTQMDRFEQYSDSVLKMGKAIFGLEKECDIAAFPEFFPIFIKILRHAIIAGDTEYANKTWFDQYVWVIQNTNQEDFLAPEKYVGEKTLDKYYESMYVIEKARLLAKVGYKSTWNSIDSVAMGFKANDPIKSYEYTNEFILLNDEENRYVLIAQIMGSVRMYGLFLALLDPEHLEKTEYLLPYLIQDQNAFDMIIYTAEQEGFVEQLAPAYVFLWTCVYDYVAQGQIENYWIGILDTESRIIDKPYCDNIMASFAGYFGIVLGDITQIPEIKDEYIALIYRGIEDYGWGTFLNLDPQQRDMVKMCYMVDNGEGDVCDNYLLNSIIELANTGEVAVGTAENLIFCARRINRVLNQNKTKVMNENPSIDKKKITLLSIARMYGQAHNEDNALYFLKGICDGDDHWMAPLYLFYGLEYLYMIEPDDPRTDNSYKPKIKNDFLDGIERLITKMSNAGRTTMLSPECQDIYHNKIQPHLYHNQQKTLYQAARKTGSQELMTMYEINVTRESPKQGGLRGLFKR